MSDRIMNRIPEDLLRHIAIPTQTDGDTLFSVRETSVSKSFQKSTQDSELPSL